MNIIPLHASAINYGTALVVAAIVVGGTTSFAFLFGQDRIFPHR
jgi:hypothetical protein